jgi:predicted unusual protein kinase regulating ubiquinone biosynthesis (AarF/ABC1/UbiB family)
VAEADAGSAGRGPIPSGRLRRTAPLAGLAARTAGEAVIQALRKRTGADGSAHDFHARTAERYTELLGHSKGVLMKVGQMLSFVSLGTAIPPEYRAVYASALSRLQADAPPMAPELAEATFEAELGRRPDEVFAEFSPEPLAAASIGQVHQARLHDGRTVAVKIQYPGVEKAIRADLDNAELLATFFALLRSMFPHLTRLDVRAVAAEVASKITEEVDYLNEAANQSQFADAYRGHPFIHIPDVLPELSTRRVLTQELAEGMLWHEAVQADQGSRDAWGEVIYRFAVGSLRRFGLFNADPHPGNYIFHPDGSVSFVDFGCVVRFDSAQVAALADIVTAMCHNDPRRLRRALVGAGAIDAVTGPAPDELFEWWSGTFEMLLGPQPFTMTPELAAEGIRREFSPVGPSASVVRSFSEPPGWVFLSRIDSGLMSVLGQLRATGYWRAIQAEYDEQADPITRLGIEERRFWQERAAR